MSIKYMNIAFETKLKPTPKLVLIVLADFANDQGELFPSLATICKKASIGKSSLAYVLKTFENLKIIKREKRNRKNGSNTSTLYTILSFDIDEKEYQKEYQKIRKYTEKKRKNHNVDKGKKSQCGQGLVHWSGHLEPPDIKEEKTEEEFLKKEYQDLFLKNPPVISYITRVKVR